MSDTTQIPEREPLHHEGRRKHPGLRKFGACALFIVTVAGIGAFCGWRDARGDQGRFDDAKALIDGYKDQVEIKENSIKRREAEIPEACKRAVFAYMSDIEGREATLEDAQELFAEDTCPDELASIVEAETIDYRDLAYNKHMIALEEPDLAVLAEDAANSHEVWQDGLKGLGVGVILVAVAVG